MKCLAPGCQIAGTVITQVISLNCPTMLVSLMNLVILSPRYFRALEKTVIAGIFIGILLPLMAVMGVPTLNVCEEEKLET